MQCIYVTNYFFLAIYCLSITIIQILLFKRTVLYTSFKHSIPSYLLSELIHYLWAIKLTFYWRLWEGTSITTVDENIIATTKMRNNFCSPSSYRSSNFAIGKVFALDLFASLFVYVLYIGLWLLFCVASHIFSLLKLLHLFAIASMSEKELQLSWESDIFPESNQEKKQRTNIINEANKNNNFLRTNREKSNIAITILEILIISNIIISRFGGYNNIFADCTVHYNVRYTNGASTLD